MKDNETTVESIRACIETATKGALDKMSNSALLQMMRTPLEDFQPEKS